MKLENLDKAQSLAYDIARLKYLTLWQENPYRAEPQMEVVTSGGLKGIYVTLSEADAIIDRYRADLEKRAEEIGVEL
jgi:hypothetical protein